MLLRHLRLHPGDHTNVIVLHRYHLAVIVLEDWLLLDLLNKMLHEEETLKDHNIGVEMNGRILR